MEEELRQLKYREEVASAAAVAAMTQAEEARQVFAGEKAKAQRLAEEKLALELKQQKAAEQAQLALKQMKRLEENVARTMADVELARSKYEKDQIKVKLLEEETRNLQAVADREQAQEQELLRQLEQFRQRSISEAERAVEQFQRLEANVLALRARERQLAERVELQQQLEEKEKVLKDKAHDLERHKIFSKFLEDVVNDTSGNNEAFENIEDL
jgi:hypothetical protein